MRNNAGTDRHVRRHIGQAAGVLEQFASGAFRVRLESRLLDVTKGSDD